MITSDTVNCSSLEAYNNRRLKLKSLQLEHLVETLKDKFLPSQVVEKKTIHVFQCLASL